MFYPASNSRFSILHNIHLLLHMACRFPAILLLFFVNFYSLLLSSRWLRFYPLSIGLSLAILQAV